MKKICAAILAVMMSLSLVACGGEEKKASTYEDTISKFVQAQANMDIRAVLDLMPEQFVTYTLEEEGYSQEELDEFIAEFEEYFQEAKEYLAEYLGEEWEATYQIASEENYLEEDLEDINDYYNELGFDMEVTAAKEVEVVVEYKGTEASESMDLDMYLVEIDGAWYIDFETLYELDW